MNLTSRAMSFLLFYFTICTIPRSPFFCALGSGTLLACDTYYSSSRLYNFLANEDVCMSCELPRDTNSSAAQHLLWRTVAVVVLAVFFFTRCDSLYYSSDCIAPSHLFSQIRHLAHGYHRVWQGVLLWGGAASHATRDIRPNARRGASHRVH